VKLKLKNNLSTVRQKNGYSQEELATILGVKQQTLSSWEIGRTLPKPYQMQKIEDILKVKKENIFFEAFNYKM